MVDPNRKINRLTEEDIEFLDECANEFADRFTDKDEEFSEHCKKGFPDPPVIENWCNGGGGGGGVGGGQFGYNNRNNNSGGGQRNYRGGDNRGSYNNRWQRRGGRYENDRHDRRYQVHRQNHPYGKFQRRNDHDTQHNEQQQSREHQMSREQQPQYGKRAIESRNTSPQNSKRVRRDYGNFVPASKD